MTGRERLISDINNMSNKELAELINGADTSCIYCANSDENCNGDDHTIDCCDNGFGCIKGIAKWLESEVKPTPDYMLEKLGYEIDKEDTSYATIAYTKKEFKKEEIPQIIIDKVSLGFSKRLKKENIPMLITKKELEVINKKINEIEMNEKYRKTREYVDEVNMWTKLQNK